MASRPPSSADMARELVARDPMARPPVKKPAIAAAVAAMIAGTIALEGGYVNHPADPGGETNMGITKKVAIEHGYTGPMRTLPRDVATSIYFESYIKAPGFEPLVAKDAAVTEELFDTAVNMGPPRPSLWFQQSINALCPQRVATDGRVGPATIAAFAACQKDLGAGTLCVSMLNSLDAKQRAEYERIVRVRPASAAFLKGWLRHRIGNVDRRKCGRAA